MRRLLTIVSITAVVIIGLLIMGVLLSDTTAQPVQKVYTPEQLLKEANKLRAEKSVAPLKLDPRLNQSAQWKADDMVKTGVNHISSDGARGNTKINVFTNDSCQWYGENLQMGDFESPFTYDGGWPTSKGHYESLIRPRFDLTGFGIKVDGDKVYYVQHFCDLK